MTNPSFSKISDLILPSRTGAKAKGADRQAAPAAAKQFERLLQTVNDRDVGRLDQTALSKPRPFEPSRPDVRNERPVADRPGHEAGRPERPEGQTRAETDRADAKAVEDTEPAGRRETDESEASEEGEAGERAAGRGEADERPDDPGDGDGDGEGATTVTEEEAGTELRIDGSVDGDGEADSLLTEAAAPTEQEATAEADTDSAGTAETVVATAPVESDAHGGVTEDGDGEEETVEQTGALTAAAVAVNTEQVAQPLGQASTTATGGEASAEEAETAAGTTPVEVSADGDAEQGSAQGAPNDEAALNDDGAADVDGADTDGRPESAAQPQAGGGSASDGEQPIAPVSPGASTATVPNAATATVSAAASGITTPTVGGTTAATTVTGTTAQASQAGQAVDGEGEDLLWRQVRRAIGSMRTIANGEQQMTIRLRPAELGAVMIRINTGDAGTTVALVAESAAAANQLSQQRQQLISELEDGGLTEVAVDVGTSDNAETEGEDADGDGDRGPGDGLSSLADQSGESIDRFRAGRAGVNSGLVDLDL